MRPGIKGKGELTRKTQTKRLLGPLKEGGSEVEAGGHHHGWALQLTGVRELMALGKGLQLRIHRDQDLTKLRPRSGALPIN